MNPSKFSGARKYTLVLELCEYAPASKLKINSVIIHLSPPLSSPQSPRTVYAPDRSTGTPSLPSPRCKDFRRYFHRKSFRPGGDFADWSPKPAAVARYIMFLITLKSNHEDFYGSSRFVSRRLRKRFALGPTKRYNARRESVDEININFIGLTIKFGKKIIIRTWNLMD